MSALFKVGDRIGKKVSNISGIGYARYGVIESIRLGTGRRSWSRGTEYTINWDGHPDKYPVGEDYIELEEVVQAQITKLQQEKQIIEAQTKSLLDNAAALINQAAKISSDNGHELCEMNDLVGDLLDAIDAAGWSSSSMNSSCG
jgi:hypothetical protein